LQLRRQVHDRYQSQGGGLANGILGPVGNDQLPSGATPAIVGGFHDIFAGDLNTGMGSMDIGQALHRLRLLDRREGSVKIPGAGVHAAFCFPRFT
jgi:hypothetical protein